ncbi:MAG: hypothetical protein IT307_17965, partial [Chloroflexi bacterium]|nr:hypothetical protein [Chloroflexota bacterium]
MVSRVASPRRCTRRQLLSRLTIGIVIPPALSVLAACSSVAPAVSPTSSKPAAAAAPASPAPAASAAAAPAPSAAASPATASPVARVAPGSSQPLDTLVFATTTNVQTIMLPVGIEKGIFLKQNIDLKLKPLNSGTEGIKAVQAGEANFASLAFA